MGGFISASSAHTSSGAIDTAKFGILTQFDPFVSRTQAGQTEIGEFLGMYLDDPRLHKRPRRVVYVTDGAGAHVVTAPRSIWNRCNGDFNVPNEVFVKFRIPCPEFRGEVFDVLATYVAGADAVYFEGTTTDLEGDFWSCVTSTSAGESPATAAAKWERIEFPAWLRTPVARKAFADWLRYGGARDAAKGEDSEATDSLFQAQIQFGAMQGQGLSWRRSA
jgi:hypothetical protein